MFDTEMIVSCRPEGTSDPAAVKHNKKKNQNHKERSEDAEDEDPTHPARKRMKGKRGLDGRLPSCRAHGQVRGTLQLFWSRAERS